MCMIPTCAVAKRNKSMDHFLSIPRGTLIGCLLNLHGIYLTSPKGNIYEYTRLLYYSIKINCYQYPIMNNISESNSS